MTSHLYSEYRVAITRDAELLFSVWNYCTQPYLLYNLVIMKIYSNSTKLGIRHLRYAVAVARNLSLTGAAQDCNVALSAVSETIKQIEEDVGVTLFDRTQRPLIVTEFGLYFVRDAIEVLNRFDQSIRDMRDFGGKEKGLVRVAASPSIVSTVVIPALAQFRKSYPNIEFAVHQENAKNVSEQLRLGFIEIGIHECWKESENLSSELLLTDKFGLVCGLNHPLANRSLVSFKEISNSTVIQLSDDTGIRKRLDEQTKISDFLRVDIETSDATTLVNMISQNIGISVLPEIATMIPAGGGLCFVPIEGLELTRKLYLLSSKNRPISPAADAFMNIIRTLARSHPNSV